MGGLNVVGGECEDWQTNVAGINRVWQWTGCELLCTDNPNSLGEADGPIPLDAGDQGNSVLNYCELADEPPPNKCGIITQMREWLFG